MNVRDLLLALGDVDPDAEILISGDPAVLGDGSTMICRAFAPRLSNITWEPGDEVILWPDRDWIDALEMAWEEDGGHGEDE